MTAGQNVTPMLGSLHTNTCRIRIAQAGWDAYALPANWYVQELAHRGHLEKISDTKPESLRRPQWLVECQGNVS